MRAEVRYENQDVIDEAVSATRASFAQQGVAGFTAPHESTPPQLFTTAGTDAQGNTITCYPAMTQLDSTQTGASTS